MSTRRHPNSGACLGADYSDEEREFMVACERRKRELGLMALPWDEVLRVAVSLGWRKVGEGESDDSAFVG
jgi:hypothetical protein